MALGAAAGRGVSRIAGRVHSAHPDDRRTADLRTELQREGRDAEQFPNALVTMRTWITESRGERDRILADVLAPLLSRDVDELRARVCVGSPEHCAELLSRYARAGCQRVYLWPLGDERRQVELAATQVAPRIDS